MVKWLEDLAPADEEQIAQRILGLTASECAQSSSAENEEALRSFLSSISGLLSSALRGSSGKDYLSGTDRAETRFPAFCESEARSRRDRGESPAQFVNITRNCLSGYLELIDRAGAPPDEKRDTARFLESFFDRLALGVCLEWCRLAEEEVAEMEKKAMQDGRSRGIEQIARFASGVAHEVRNPLHALMSVTEALGKELQNDREAETYLHHIRTQIDRLSQLMKDLLQVGKPVDPSKIRSESLQEICLAAISAWKDSKAGKGRAVSFACQPGEEEVAVLSDGLTLQKILLNLLDNAGQHSPPGSEIRVAISCSGEKFASVQVTDRGSGVPQELGERIFEPFFSTRRGGTGLGLTIARDSLESQGGSLSVWNNDPPPGATAEISLPRAERGKQ